MPAGDKVQSKVMTIILRAKDRTAQAFMKLRQNNKQSVEAVKKGVKVMKGAFLALNVAILAVGAVAMKKMIQMSLNLVKSSLKVADMFESLELQISNLRGSAEEGKRVFDELWDTAKKIPFTIDEIARGAKAMEAWGVMGEDVQTVMLGLADASATAGVSIDMMSNVIGRAFQQGTFLSRGPGALLRGIMKTKMGIDATTLSTREFQLVLAKLLTDPQYGVAGMSEKLASTWTGIKSMISDSVTVIKKTIADAGVFEEVKKTGKAVMVFLRGDMIVKAMQRIGQIAGSVVTDFRKKFLDLIASGQMETLIDDWVNNFAKWSSMAKGIIANLPAIGQAIMNMVSSFTMALNMFIKSVNSLLSALSTVGIGTSLKSELKDIEHEYRNIKSDLDDYVEQFRKKNKFMGAGAQERYLQREDAVFKSLTKQLNITKKQYSEKYKLYKLIEDGKLIDIDIEGINKKTLEQILKIQEAMKGNNVEGEKMAKTMAEILNAFKIQEEKFISMEDRWKKFMETLQDMGRIGAGGLQSSFEQLFFDASQGRLQSLKVYFMNFFADISREMSKILSKKLVMSLFSAGGDGGVDAMGVGISALSSAGGVAGGIPSIGASAVTGNVPGFSKGGIVGGTGRGDNQIIRTSKGEMILNKQQQKNLINFLGGSGGGGGSNITLIVQGAMDGKDVFNTLQRNSDAVGAWLMQAGFNGVRGIG